MKKFTLKNQTSFGITAKIMVKWDHYKAKFQPKQFATVLNVSESLLGSKRKMARVNQTGRVVAVSTPDGIRMRGRGRESTRYYLQFSDGQVLGYESHHLTRGVDPSIPDPLAPKYTRESFVD